jgi:hypothetical protein
MRSLPDSPEMSERANDADHTVAAHPEGADIVEEDHSSGVRGIRRLAEQRADEHIRPTWFVDDSGAKAIVLRAKQVAAIRHRAGPQVGTSLDDDASWLAGRVRIDDANALDHFQGN